MASDWKEALGALAGSLPNQSEPAADENPLPQQKAALPDPRKLRIDFERKGRVGKCATIISGFDGLDDDEIARIAADLKRRLATGGSSRGGEILIQGDRRNEIKKYFNIK